MVEADGNLNMPCSHRSRQARRAAQPPAGRFPHVQFRHDRRQQQQRENTQGAEPQPEQGGRGSSHPTGIPGWRRAGTPVCLSSWPRPMGVRVSVIQAQCQHFIWNVEGLICLFIQISDPMGTAGHHPQCRDPHTHTLPREPESFVQD